MSSLDTTSLTLSSYLLQRWTLLDRSCPICFTPMVRSPPPAHLLHCVRCGRDTTLTVTSPTPLPNGTHSSPTSSSVDESNRPPANYHPFVNGDDMDSDDEQQEAGVMQVEVQSESNQALMRREQSDRASKLIGEKMLQGYCLLDEICPTETCFGVPLMRLANDTLRRTCVICQKIYPETTPRDATNITAAAPLPQTVSPAVQPFFPLMSSASGMPGQNSKDLLEKAYGSLAGELVRLTESLSRFDTVSKEYDDCLNRIQRVVEIMHSMRK